MRPSELLVAARDLIKDEKKWIKETIDSGDGAFCAIGALCEADLDGRPFCLSTTYSHTYYDARRYLDDLLPRGFRIVELYNDHPETTHEDIMILFNEAIKAAEKDEAEVP